MMFSIIMPVYNAEHFLAESIESVVLQSYGNWELIAIDDGSKDNSLDILKAYASRDSRIRICSQKNQGVSETRNRGLALVRGDYILFLDADDTWHEDTLHTIHQVIQDYACDVVTFNMYRMDASGKIKGKVTTPLSETLLVVNSEDKKKQYIYPLLCGKKSFGLVGNFAVKSPLAGSVRFRTDMIMCEDLLFDMQMYQKAKTIVCLPDYFYYYRCNPTGTVNQFNYQKIEDIKLAYHAKIELARGKGLPEEIQNHALAFFFASIIQFYHSILHDTGLCKEYKQKICGDQFIMDELQRYRQLSEQPVSLDILLGSPLKRWKQKYSLLAKRKIKNAINHMKGK